MRHEIENMNRSQNPEQTVGLSQQKIRSAAAELSFRAGQKGKTVMTFDVCVWRFF